MNWRNRKERALSVTVERSADNAGFYSELIENLRSEMVAKFGSVAEFCRQNSISRQNLCEVFSGRQDISVGLYFRVCAALKVVGEVPTMYNVQVSLRDYMAVDHDKLFNSILNVLLR